MPDHEQTTPENGAESFERCEQCHAPVDQDQRYCVNCGAHRRGVPDPAARYMGQVTSRSVAGSGAAGTALVATTRRGSTEIGLLGALALALIPVAAAVGIAIGRSSNNQDAKLYSALERQQVRTTTVVGGASAAASAGSSSASASTTAAAAQRARAKTAKAAKAARAGKSKPAAVSASTANGKVTKVTGAKVTAAQRTQGSSDAKKVQSSTGKNYVQADNNLPSSVVVGP